MFEHKRLVEKGERMKTKTSSRVGVYRPTNMKQKGPKPGPSDVGKKKNHSLSEQRPVSVSECGFCEIDWNVILIGGNNV